MAGLAAPSLARAAAFPQRIVSLDYGLAETLIEIGLPPVGLVSADEWDTWCVEPPLPGGVANIGANTEVNMDLLAQLKPDLIVSTPFLEGVRSQLERIAPVTSFAIHDVGGSPYPHILAATRRLGEVTGRREAAEALIGRSKEIFRKARRDTASLRDHPLVFISFLDARHVRVFGPGGNFHDVLDLLGLRNGWTQTTNSWGFATIGYERLPSDPGTRLFYVEPVPPDVFPRLEGSPLWQSLAFVRSGRIARMETVFMFGMLPAMTRFARLLGEIGHRDA
ncbi:iron-siderophore ABC transporter substrate-binding protein [Roseibium salinum]|uniref:Iron-siderophore ABC transporter substrate-binding protein n=1 Tax=Roseibium salinum TaxID=1604349 RepID=A0ABT3QWZ7_9HYPH|nr:iron-siderophore ABC transporter substrate-binding protein [Roseibium sp. DSM 29163]MCX2721420.1 iron-siderophore ABC transporter substrate-binding protein [Roseibium sp. DSM 29163]MDN3721897.1 iron-siderophore ABC transporter substrate-binding protein [Roseibium salinum]